MTTDPREQEIQKLARKLREVTEERDRLLAQTIPDTYGSEFNDAAWVFVESLPDPDIRRLAVSAPIKPALRAFVDALLSRREQV